MGHRLGRVRTIPLGLSVALALALILTAGPPLEPTARPLGLATGPSSSPARTTGGSAATAVGNFSAALGRLVELLGLAGSGLLSLVWARVALSWFSNDVTKKVLAKDRARDALIGTLLFTAAVTGLFWGLAHWVLTGS
jgi:hypothetical protein